MNDTSVSSNPRGITNGLTRLSSAKINLALHVTGQRADGYHLLDSLICFTEFGDRVSITPGTTSTFEIAFSKSGPFADHLCRDEDNLAFRAAKKLRELGVIDGHPCPSVAIHLEKQLPIASGMGGGSANAAAVLNLLKEFWLKDNLAFDLLPIARELGADVAMCLDSKPKRIDGIGDEICGFEIGFSLPMVLVNCLQEVPTPAIFSGLLQKTNAKMNIVPSDYKSFSDAVDSMRKLRNDLQPVASDLFPSIADNLELLSKSQGCHLARMTGSGGTCIGIFENFDAAQDAVEKINDSHPNWWAIATRSIASTEN